ncbi:MAG TPA: PDZ domain-containing protein, partial [Polyangiales bacterium]|nr:PDZ domain-containing protein [Polyangiales bacterium]
LRVTPDTRVRARATAPRARIAKRPALTTRELDAGIRRLSADRFAVTRELLERGLTSLTALRRGVRYQLAREDGRVVGVKVTALPPDSPLARLGIERGDVIRSLNGLALSEPGGALQALAALRVQPQFSLAVLRSGQPRSLHYAVE